jgi:hypothetical protein
VTTPPPVPPTPTPPPNPLPTVEVHLPQDLVNKLAPQHGCADWWYISGAALIAALVAIIAAIVAYNAVIRQINTSAGDLKKQIDANAENVRKRIDAEEKRRKRAERLDVVTEAYGVVHEVLDWATRGGRRGTDAAKQEFKALDLKMLTVTAKLNLIDMDHQRSVCVRVLEAGPRYGQLKAGRQYRKDVS